MIYLLRLLGVKFISVIYISCVYIRKSKGSRVVTFWKKAVHSDTNYHDVRIKLTSNREFLGDDLKMMDTILMRDSFDLPIEYQYPVISALMMSQ